VALQNVDFLSIKPWFQLSKEHKQTGFGKGNSFYFNGIHKFFEGLEAKIVTKYRTGSCFPVIGHGKLNVSTCKGKRLRNETDFIRESLGKFYFRSLYRIAHKEDLITFFKEIKLTSKWAEKFVDRLLKGNRK